MKFKYQAKTKTGELQAGFAEGVNREAVLNLLQGNDLYILGLESVERPAWYESFVSMFERVRQVDLMLFTRQFATLLSAQISLGDSLKTLQRQTVNRILKDVIFELSSDVDAGLSLSQALERHPTIFSTFYVNMIRSSEVSGRLEEIMSYLADYLESQVGIATKVRDALIYPIILVGLFFVVSFILVVFVFPTLRPIFEEAGIQLPLLSRVLLTGGAFIGEWWWAALIFLIISVFFIVDYFRSPEGRAVYDELRIKLPVLGDLFRKLYIARFADVTSVLLKGGIPLAPAVEIAAHTVGNATYRDMLHETAEAIRRGELMSQSIERQPLYFPPLVSQMIAVGETTGRLEELLRRVSQFYLRDVDSLVANLVQLIQPLMLVVIGVFVALMFASILLPIYSLVQTF